MWALINRIRDLSNKDWEVNLLHTWRAGNRCANFLANLGHSFEKGLSCFDKPHGHLIHLLFDDCSAASFRRVV